jgi:thioredoxin-related protein
MKKAMFSIAVAAVVFLSSAFSLNNDPVSLELGKKAPMTDHKMEDIYGQTHSLQSLNGKSGLLVIFSCNTCPFVVGREGKSMGWESRYNDLHKIAGELGFGSVLVNSNEAKREGDDSKEAMMRQVKEKGYMMPYVIDKNHQLADAFGARTTPHVYLFDANMNLVYKGAIDDNVDNPKEVKEHYLIDAMNAVAKGQAVVTGETKAIGCSIKRMS